MLDTSRIQTPSGDRIPVSHWLRQSNVRLEALIEDGTVALEIEESCRAVDVTSLETSVKYSGYLRRQEHEVERARRDERRRIPADFPYDRIPGLSREVVQRLSQIRPDTFGQALRIPGVTPAAVAVISAYVGRFQPTP
jgi:tRNA uridine 5-carboxymethylaminomethyl modification enzyme